MKKILMLAVAGLTLTACESSKSAWRNDCQGFHSINAREHKACMARVEEGRSLDGTQDVTVSPLNAVIDNEGEMTKDRGDHNDSGESSL